jgi:hypothetical protein
MAFRCPNCKKRVPDKTDTCPKCGQKFTEEEVRRLTAKYDSEARLGLIILGAIIAEGCLFYFNAPLAIVLLIFLAPTLFFAYRAHKYKKEATWLLAENEKLAPYKEILDAHAHAAHVIEEAQEKADLILADAKMRLSIAKDKENDATSRLQSAIDEGSKQAKEIVSKASALAVEIAGDAFEAKGKADFYERTAVAMKNIISGYGNEYVIPSHTLLDDLAETYGYTQAADALKKARAFSRDLVKGGRAGKCDYVENSRSNTAINFVIDAFNGKADSILSRAKMDNYGKLKQEMIDALNLVNYNGQSFRNATITDEYFKARMEELRLACVVLEIRQRDLEEQRRIKEQIREEEKARREIEKALRDSAKEEETLQKAMEKVRAQMDQANEEQRSKYEAQIAELEQKWKEAEERSKRAQSLAELTKRGHVYIISNVGSFGENIYKIGMTRRVDPSERIRELGDASVPFSFDIHAMIWAEDAPGLESALHKKFALEQVNKVNYRKEFFRAKLEDIRKELEAEKIEAKWTMAAEAREYYESLAIEETLKDNPEAQKAWLEREFELEASRPVGVLLANEFEEEAV